MIHWGVGLLFLFWQLLRQATNREIPIKIRWVEMSFFLLINISWIIGIKRLEQLVGVMLIQLLFSRFATKDFLANEASSMEIAGYLPIMMGYRILFWQEWAWQEYMAVGLTIFIGYLSYRFSKKIMERADYLLLLNLLIVVGFSFALLLFIVSLILAVLLGLLLHFTGKNKGNLELPYIPILAISFWGTMLVQML